MMCAAHSMDGMGWRVEGGERGRERKERERGEGRIWRSDKASERGHVEEREREKQQQKETESDRKREKNTESDRTRQK